MDYFNQESERLKFRKLNLDDINAWTSFFENNDRLTFLGIDITKDPRTLSTEWIHKQLERYKNEGLGHLAVIEKDTGNFIGMGGILPRILNEKPEYEIAYSLKPNYWGKGYGTEIAQQMRLFGTEKGIATSFISIIHKDNKASKHVATKNGMKVQYKTEFMGMKVYVYGDN